MVRTLLLLIALVISWNSSPDKDTSGYKVYLGKESKRYKFFENAGNVTEYTFILPAELDSADTIFCAVTAYDTLHNESDFSIEAWWTPDSSYSPPDTTDPDTTLPPPIYPNRIVLFPSYPNPSGGHTTVPFYLPGQQTAVRLYVFDVSGKFNGIYLNDIYSKGYYTYRLNISHLPTGIYLYQLRDMITNIPYTRKLTIIK